MIVRKSDLLPGEHRDVVQDVKSVIQDADTWLDTPNDRLGGQKPRDLINTPDEIQLRYLVRAIKYGGIT
jgi:hypothetical protein